MLQYRSHSSYSIAGAVTDRAGNPLEGATVRLRALPGNSYRSLITDVPGSYRFDKLQAGKYVLFATYLGTEGFVSDTLLLDHNLEEKALPLHIILFEKQHLCRK
ncbi:carboxypeptidase-like regulatory domain-containing protein [Pontibacter sp. SGAir0037]|uniref:carboxypeptidase-like regulatory domain-containing protein n=1 Tax=Pontibacter sp. SGAir0037 TaxID=2571030 RepID=UPI00143CFD2D|nr:carboxypeptidase-like regulatory domain-containing protein [Pontibacter sp. SGAir0037]